MKRKPRFWPTLYVLGKPTHVCIALGQCSVPGGHPHPFTIYTCSWCFNVNRQRPFRKLESAHLAECGPYGPRGGKRWRLTEKGQAALQIINTYKPGTPEMHTALTLIGYPRR